MKIEHTEIYGFRAAFRGLRNPKESWEKSDSKFYPQITFDEQISWQARLGNANQAIRCFEFPYLGPKDLHLAQSLIKAGDDHGKFTRQIIIWCDWTLPIYVWSEADTYKVATVRNSCSTMHKLGTRFLLLEDFEDEDMKEGDLLELNLLGQDYRQSKLTNFDLVRKMKKKLPSSYLLKATMTFSYQTARHMYFGRRAHRLPEWSGPKGICEWLSFLPYGRELIIGLE